MAEDTTYVCHQTRRNQPGAPLESSPVLTSVHDAGRHSAK